MQLHGGKQTAQRSWAPQDSKWGILIPPFFFWHQSDLFGHKEKEKAHPHLPPQPSEKDWEMREQIVPGLLLHA